MTIDSIMNPTQPTKAQVLAGLRVAAGVTEAIREAGEIPSGTLYAMLCDRMDLAAYEALIRTIKRTGLVEERGHLLRWTGPKLEAK